MNAYFFGAGVGALIGLAVALGQFRIEPARELYDKSTAGQRLAYFVGVPCIFSLLGTLFVWAVLHGD